MKRIYMRRSVESGRVPERKKTKQRRTREMTRWTKRRHTERIGGKRCPYYCLCFARVGEWQRRLEM
jgi:hypothetical protein